MATRNPSLYDWQNLTRNDVGGNFADAFQGYRAPNEWSLRDSSNGSPLGGPRNPMSDEQLLLLMNGRNSNRTRALRTAGDLQRAQEEAQFLDSIQGQDTAGIYSTPTDERSAALQTIMNRDYTARERGSALSMQAELDNVKAIKDWLPLIMKRQDMNADEKQRVIANKFARDKFAQDTEDHAQNRQINQQRIDATNEYNNSRLGQFDQSIAGRQANQNANRAQRQQQIDARTQTAEAAKTERDLNAIIVAARKGADMGYLDTAGQSLFPKLNDAQKGVFLATIAERAQRGTAEGMAADRANQMLGAAAHNAIASGGRFEDAVPMVMQEINKDPIARGKLVWNQALKRIVPAYNNPAMSSLSQETQNGGGFSAAMQQPPPQQQQSSGATGMFNGYGGMGSAQQGASGVQPDGFYKDQSGVPYQVVNGQRLNPPAAPRQARQQNRRGVLPYAGGVPYGSNMDSVEQPEGSIPSPLTGGNYRAPYSLPRVPIDTSRLYDDFGRPAKALGVGAVNNAGAVLKPYADWGMDAYDESQRFLDSIISGVPLLRQATGQELW